MYGPMKERERKKEWLESTGSCPLCYAAAQREKEETEILARIAEQAILNLPELEGSEKQNAWARKIRATMIADLIRVAGGSVEEFARRMARTSMNETEEKGRKYIDEMIHNPQSSWWIEARDTTLREIARNHFARKEVTT
jgi:hypothetical protein